MVLLKLTDVSSAIQLLLRCNGIATCTKRLVLTIMKQYLHLSVTGALVHDEIDDLNKQIERISMS